MFKFKSIEDITSSKEEYEFLVKFDNIFVVKGKKPDDNNLIEAVSDLTDFAEWRVKLRGDRDGPVKIRNNENDFNYFHGYVYGVNSENLLNFEKQAMIVSLTTGYTLEKVGVSQIKKELKDTHFNSLFEE